jgi:hypothetical protein
MMRVFASLLSLTVAPRVFVHGYDLLINASGGFYLDIVDSATNVTIGGMFQDPVFDSSGSRRIGTNQGYEYYFDNPDMNATEMKSNSNRYMFLDGGNLIMLNSFIVAGTGKYEKFTGGMIQERVVPDEVVYAAEVTLIEKNDKPAITDLSDDKIVTNFRVTSAGGYYFPITDDNFTQIGEKFQNPMMDSDDNVIGVNQGFAYNFPNDTYVKELLNTNRIFQFDDGERIFAINQVVVFGSGPYQKYEGSTFLEDIISADPDYVANITLVIDAADTAKDDATVANSDVVLRITSENGFHEEITDSKTGNHIFQRFQNHVFDVSTGARIGTNQGYGFVFPPNNYTVNIQRANRHFYMNEGSLVIYNEVIVGATGIYKRFTGGNVTVTVHSHSSDPYYNATILLMEPSNGEESPAESSNGSGGSYRHTIVEWSILYVLSQSFLSFMG